MLLFLSLFLSSPSSFFRFHQLHFVHLYRKKANQPTYIHKILVLLLSVVFFLILFSSCSSLFLPSSTTSFLFNDDLTEEKKQVQTPKHYILIFLHMCIFSFSASVFVGLRVSLFRFLSFFLSKNFKAVICMCVCV